MVGVLPQALASSRCCKIHFAAGCLMRLTVWSVKSLWQETGLLNKLMALYRNTELPLKGSETHLKIPATLRPVDHL